MSKQNTPFISTVDLSGYKSINSVSVELTEGLNILIGKNAVGKTNFLTFLDKILSLDFEELVTVSSQISFSNITNLKILKFKKTFLVQEDEKTFLRLSDLKINDDTIVSKEDLEKMKILPETVYIKHGVPMKYPFLNEQVSFLIDSTNQHFLALPKVLSDKELPLFVRNTAFELSWNILTMFFSKDSTQSKKELTKIVNDTFLFDEVIQKFLKNYTPVSGFRISDGFSISKNETEFNVSNLIFEFEIEGLWYNYNDLSDGTKRLFHIISDIVSAKENPSKSYIFLIEEPELGIHPHQYFKLLQFLKQESENFQIIITTHSPQSLNILGNDELERIILVDIEKNKTNLRHLTNAEKKKAIEYKKDNMYLSDYWLYSDLES